MTKLFLPHVPSRHDPLSGSRVPSVDLNPLSPLGELCMLLPFDRYRIDTNDLPEALDQIQHNIQNITLNDAIVAIGDPILISAAIAYAHDILGTVRVLRWDRKQQSYQVIEFTL